MNENFMNGFEKVAKQMHINWIHTDGLNSTELNDLKSITKKVREFRHKTLSDAIAKAPGATLEMGGSTNWRDDVLEAFFNKYPQHKKTNKVYAGGGMDLKGPDVSEYKPGFFGKLFGRKASSSGMPNGQAIYISQLEGGAGAARNPLAFAHINGKNIGDIRDAMKRVDIKTV